MVFDSEGSYWRNKQTGQILPIENRDGSFELDLWVQENNRGIVQGEEQSTFRKGQRYSELIDSEDQEEEDSIDMGFIRQASWL